MQIDSYFPYIISAYILAAFLLFFIGAASVIRLNKMKKAMSELEKRKSGG